MTESKTTKKSILIGGITFSFVILLISLSATQLYYKTNPYNGNTLFLSRLAIWFCLLLTYIYSSKVEKQNFLPWKENNYSFLGYIKTFFILLFMLIPAITLGSLLVKLSGGNTESLKLDEIVAILSKNIALLLFFCITAGITEELLFRGYILPRFNVLLKNSYLSIAISSLLFGILHYSYGTFIQVIGPFLLGVVFAIHYNKYRNIKIIILCHFLWDLMGMLIKTNYFSH
jgi:membrane protease YdiL (CAAX protease family)